MRIDRSHRITRRIWQSSGSRKPDVREFALLIVSVLTVTIVLNATNILKTESERELSQHVRQGIAQHHALLTTALKQLLDEYEYDENLRITQERFRGKSPAITRKRKPSRSRKTLKVEPVSEEAKEHDEEKT